MHWPSARTASAFEYFYNFAIGDLSGFLQANLSSLDIFRRSSVLARSTTNPRRITPGVSFWPSRPAIVLQRPSLDTLEAPKPGFTRRFPSAVSPTRPSPRRRRFGTSASSPTSTTASPRWPTGCCSSPASSTSGRCAPSTSTGWTSSASAASPSRRRTCGCRGTFDGTEYVPASDRHPRPRRLHLRGVARAGGLRGCGAAGRRRPGHRGADAGQPVPGAGPRPAHHSGAQQDRPARRRPRPLRRRDRPHHRL